jgi:hypothetical protein
VFDETDCKKMYPEVGDGVKTLDVFITKVRVGVLT